MSDDVGLARIECDRKAVAQLVGDDGGRIAVENVETAGKQSTNERERHRLTVGERTALEEVDGFGSQFDPVLELVQQPRLPDPCVTDNGHRAARHRAGNVPERASQHVELTLPTDHAGLDTLDTARRNTERARLRAMDDVRVQWLALAFDAQRSERLDIEHAAHV